MDAARAKIREAARLRRAELKKRIKAHGPRLDRIFVFGEVEFV